MLGILLTSLSAFAIELRFPEELLSTYGNADRVGIEAEFYNLPLERAGLLVSMAVNGTLEIEQYQDVIFRKESGMTVKEVVTRKRAVIRDSDIGTVVVKPEDNEVDMVDSLDNSKKRILELVTMPITLDKVHHVQKALDFLVGAGALGTAGGEAVSLQVNVELGEGQAENIDAEVLVEMIRIYSSPENRQRILSLLNPATIRQEYIQEFSPGLLKRVNQPNYRPSKRQLYNDLMYRQLAELLGDQRAWTKPIRQVQDEVLKHLRKKMKEGMDFDAAFFRVIKFSRIKLASVMIFLFPDDPLSKIIVETEWIHPIPAVEYRERDNDFNILEGVRMSVGFQNQAIKNVRDRRANKKCSRLFVAQSDG